MGNLSSNLKLYTVSSKVFKRFNETHGVTGGRKHILLLVLGVVASIDTLYGTKRLYQTSLLALGYCGIATRIQNYATRLNQPQWRHWKYLQRRHLGYTVARISQ